MPTRARAGVGRRQAGECHPLIGLRARGSSTLAAAGGMAGSMRMSKRRSRETCKDCSELWNFWDWIRSDA